MKRVFLGGLVLSFLHSGNLWGFTVETASTPAGHEELIKRAVESAENLRRSGGFLESPLLFSPASLADWGNAKCGPECRRWANNVNVWSIILGARWVDVRGFAVTDRVKASGKDDVPFDNLRCWEVVAHLHDSVQYDHFLRRKNAPLEQSETGWKETVLGARKRFKALFLEAVKKTKDPSRPTISVYDRALSLYYDLKFTVPEGFFLLGRAIHLLQDSFSAEHVTRESFREDLGIKITDVKSNVCTAGAKRHAFQNGLSLQYGKECVAIDEQTAHGDVVWAKKNMDLLNWWASLAVAATRELLRTFVESLTASDVDKRIDAFMNKWIELPTKDSLTQSARELPDNKKCKMERDAYCGTRHEMVVNAQFETCLRAIEGVPEPMAGQPTAKAGAADTFLGETPSPRRPSYDAAWSGRLPLTASCVRNTKVVDGETYRHYSCPEKGVYDDSFWAGFWDMAQHTFRNFGTAWCSQGAEVIVDGISWVLERINPFGMGWLPTYKREPTLQERLKSSFWSTLVSRCIRSAAGGFISNACGTIATLFQAARSPIKWAVLDPMCRMWLETAPPVIDFLGAGVCGLGSAIVRLFGDPVTCFLGFLDKISDKAQTDGNSKEKLKNALWLWATETICDFVGGLLADLLSGGATAAGWLGKIQKAIEWLGNAASLNQLTKRVGLDLDKGQAWVKPLADNFAGAGGMIQSALESGGPGDETVAACRRLKTEWNKWDQLRK